MRRWIYRKLPYGVRTYAQRWLGVPKQGSFDVRMADTSITLQDPSRAPLLTKFYIHGHDGLRWERPTRRFLQELLEHGYPDTSPTILDVGAYLGTYAILAKASNPKAEVVAFEPLENNAQYIEDICSLNGLEGIQVSQLALSDETGSAPLYVSTEKKGLADTSSLVHRFAGSGGTFDHEEARKVEVETMRMDEFVEQESCIPDLIKVDVEEAELEVLKGADSTLRNHRPDVILEILKGYHAKEEVFDRLMGLGYRAYLITNGGLVPEDRPLTLPRPGNPNLAQWRNHLFTMRDEKEVRELSVGCFGGYLG